jgi:general secretion pathway protein J
MSRRRASRDGGFTLLEMLVAMSLLGLVMAMIFGGLRLGLRVWETGEKRSEERAEIAVAQRFLRAVIARAHPMIRAGRRNVRLVAFAGKPSRMEIATLLPPHLGPGGFSHVIVEIAGEGDKRRLEIRFAPISRDDDGQAELAGAEDSEPTLLIRDIERAEMSYYGARRRGEDPEWRDTWRDAEILPRLIRLRLSFSDGDRRTWPDLVIAAQGAQGWDRTFLRRRRTRGGAR